MRNMNFLDEISKDRIDDKIKIYEEDIKYLKKRKNEVVETIDIIWKDETITHEKADKISFDNQKLNIEYKDIITIIPYKNIKRLKFANSLLKLKYDLNWTFKTYEDSTSDGNPYSNPFVWYKYTLNVDTAGNSIW